MLAFIHSPLLYLSKVIDHRIIVFTGLQNDIRYINDDSLKIVFMGQGLLRQILTNSWLETNVQCDNIIYITQNAIKSHLFFKFRFTQFCKPNQPGDLIHCPYTTEADFWHFKTNPNKMKKGIHQKMLCWPHNILIIISFSHFAFDIFLVLNFFYGNRI